MENEKITKVLVLGAGKIGTSIAGILADSKDYTVALDSGDLRLYRFHATKIKKHDGIIRIFPELRFLWVIAADGGFFCHSRHFRYFLAVFGEDCIFFKAGNPDAAVFGYAPCRPSAANAGEKCTF